MTENTDRAETEVILNYPVTTRSLSECVDQTLKWATERSGFRWIACANPHSFMIIQRDEDFAKTMKSADMLIPDGAGVVKASRILGGSIKERITGSDIFSELNNRMNITGNMSCFFLGSSEDTLLKIREKMAGDYPNIRIAGTYAPPFKAHFSAEDCDSMAKAINTANPDVLWVGITQPKQEKLISSLSSRLNTPVAIAVGAVFDFYSGQVKRPSPLFLKMGLEWLVRLFGEPCRLWRRNLDSPAFLFYVLREKFRH